MNPVAHGRIDGVTVSMVAAVEILTSHHAEQEIAGCVDIGCGIEAAAHDADVTGGSHGFCFEEMERAGRKIVELEGVAEIKFRADFDPARGVSVREVLAQSVVRANAARRAWAGARERVGRRRGGRIGVPIPTALNIQMSLRIVSRWVLGAADPNDGAVCADFAYLDA